MADLAHSPTLAASPRVEGDDRLPPGAHAGEYVVERFVGAGAMGEVYAGAHPVLGKKVAIKVLRRELLTSSEAVERFLREARAVNAVEHAGVVDVFAHGRLDDGRLYLVMSFVAGVTLRAKLIETGPLSVDEAIALLEPIADALDAAHAKGIVHRDLKPDNIMVGDAGRVFVLDFGIAKLAGADGDGTLTGKGTWLGTPAYMAPEQWSSDGASPASDRYALGVIAYELLAGAHPFTAANVPAMMEQHFRAAVPTLTGAGVPAGADDVLARAMAKDPDARWPTARALVDALAGAAGSGPRIARAPATAPPSKRTWLAPALGVGVLALAAAIAVVTLHHGEAAQPTQAAAAPANTVAIPVTTVPDGALVSVDDKLVGAAPVTLHVPRHATAIVAVAKPGYLAQTLHLGTGDSDADSPLAVRLAAVTRFEGVWQLPDGELRALQRRDESVEISKLDDVDGPRRFFRRYGFVETARGTAFASDDEVVDPHAPDDPTCHQPVHVVYRYDAQADVLELDQPVVDVGFIDGHCVAKSTIVQTRTLVRVDVPSKTEHLPAPVGTIRMSKTRPKPAVKKTVSKGNTAAQKPMPQLPGTKDAEAPTQAPMDSKVNGQIVPEPQQAYPVKQNAVPAS
ncbi:MAG TPA: serine/threonine-protein kinase [Kofleriaceae bacterium]|nr:serine/threonine-protein kinase [Kofleriaceae bacterium]